MTTAEQQFAQRGIDAVSIRDITTAAKVNTASIHYHFGSKRELIAAIIETRSAEVLGRRAEFLDEIEEAGIPTLRELATAMVRPAAEKLADKRGRSYIGFMAAVGSHPVYSQMVTDITDKHTIRQVRMLEQLTPDLSPAVRQFRFALAKAVLINQAFGQPGEGVHLWVEHHVPGGDVDFAERLIDVIVAIFEAPSSV
jgi:AcrR family transcriptional regulator